MERQRVLAVLLLLTSEVSASLRAVNTFSLPDAATASFGVNISANTTALFLTSFGFLNGDGVWGILDAASAFEGHSVSTPPLLLDGEIHWPNQATLAPQNTVGSADNILLEAGGFFANPSKATGHIVLTDISVNPPTHTQISHDKKNFFYHHAVWRDINKDGRLDVVAARAMDPTIPIGHKPQAELLWLEQPAVNAMTSTWPEHVLTSGPGVAFIFEDLNGDGSDEVVAAQFFEEPGLYLYTCPEGSWAACNSSNVKQTAIDATLGTWCGATSSMSDGLGMDMELYSGIYATLIHVDKKRKVD
eukprot:m.170260 g.170260  ORF g.170260 m.170260 type:complete len:303 (+) comp18262_c0_seq2:57-965(+)